MGSAVAVLGCAAVIDGWSSVVSIRLLPVLPVKDRAQMIGLVQLVVEFAKKNVLFQVTWECAEQVLGNEFFRCCAGRGRRSTQDK